MERAAVTSGWTDGGHQGRARRRRDPGTPACDGVARGGRCKGDEMWRGLLGSTRNSGCGAARVNGSGTQPLATHGQEQRMNPISEGVSTPGGAPPDTTQLADVSRETWDAAPTESWATKPDWIPRSEPRPSARCDC